MNIEIKEIKSLKRKLNCGESHGGPDDAVENLLHKCKGHPIETNDSIITLDTRKLYNGGQKIQCTNVLGAIYWVEKKVLMDSNKFFAFSKVLDLEPMAMQGKSAPIIQCYYEHSQKPEMLGVPRFWGLSVFGKPMKDIRTLGHELSGCTDIDLRPLQLTAVEKLYNCIMEWGGSTMIADCGFGKTRVALKMMTKLKRKTIVLCNREILMEQWATVINELLPGLTISWLQGTSSIKKKSIKVGDKRYLGISEPSDVCIASVETLIEGGVPKELIEQFGFAIIDECHHLAASTLIHALPRIPAKYILGLSATPDRRDGLEHALYWLTGPAGFVYKRLPSITGINHTVQVYKIEANCSNKEKMYANGQLAFAEMLTLLSKDLERNKIIEDIILKCLESKRQKIIVVTGLVDHCRILKETIDSKNGAKSCVMAGKQKDSVMAKDPDVKIVYATYNLLEEGYDDPLLDTLILATPRTRVQQTIGRIERTHEGKLRPVVYDIVDSFSIYGSMWYKRLAFYNSRGFLISK